MTAEIAILNRTAVALAADSAVTLGFGSEKKIFNTVDKLFQLVCNEPIGIMIFGGAEFMQIPLETVIKKFRKSEYAKERETVKQYSEAFFDFLEKEIAVSNRTDELNVLSIIEPIIEQIKSRTRDAHFKSIANTRRPIKNFLNAYNQILHNKVKALHEYCKKREASGIIDKSIVENDYSAFIAARVEYHFPDLEKEIAQHLIESLILTLCNDTFSASHTGFVFAGFGKNEIFPTLQSFSVNGKIAGKVKRKEITFVDIDRDGTYAHIEPFAQKEMVHRFLDGIDPDYERYIESSMKETLVGFGKKIVDVTVTRNKKKRDELYLAVEAVVQGYINDFEQKSNERKGANYRKKILDMVQYMPKSDIANMAESLVNLTSTKRKVSAESETVGGPVDVAVISKYDGFIWIKRKHYFDADLNPRFFGNK